MFRSRERQNGKIRIDGGENGYCFSHTRMVEVARKQT
jgi:hypothetical protein